MKTSTLLRALAMGVAQLWLLLLHGVPAVAGAGLPAAPTLTEALNPDGTLRTEVQGSFDARGFRMTMGPDGRPAFRPVSTTGAGDEFWQNGFGLAGTNGIVYTVVQAGSNVYIGGTFSSVGNIVANNVARWDGTRWHSLGSGASNGVKGGTVRALAVIGTDVYVGAEGLMLTAGISGILLKWNGSTWGWVGPTQASDVNGTVSALAVMGPDLYVGGVFNSVGGVSAKAIAKWNGSSWSSLGSGVDAFSLGAGQSGAVYALGVQGNQLYVGGFFTQAGSRPANYIARWDGSNWNSLGTGLSGGSTNTVVAIAVSGTDVYVAGGFVQAGSATVNRIARWDGSNWSSLSTGMGTGSPRALAVLGGSLYVGGEFTEAGGVAVNNVARWNGTSWSGLGTGATNGVNQVRYSPVGALAAIGNELYVGGTFSRARDIRADGLARWNGSTWLSFATAGAPVNGAYGYLYSEPAVNAVAVIGSSVYVSGTFDHLGGAVASIVRWDGASWSTLGTGLNGSVSAMAVAGTSLYVCGSFSQAGGVAASGVARWDGTSWSSLGTGIFTGTVQGGAYALAVSGSDVYVGGRFTQAGGVAASNIAKWNGSSWSALGTGVSGGISGNPSYVNAIAVSGANVYVGGVFTQAGGTTVDNISRWDGTRWNSLGSGIPAGIVSALAVSGTDLYVGGRFAQAGGVAASNIAKWDGTNWSSLGGGIATGTVSVLAVSGADVYVGGNFTQAGTTAANNIAKWNGNSWSSLGTGTNKQVFALTAVGTRVYVGGNFVATGDESKMMNGWGIYDPAVPTATAAAARAAAASLYPNPASQQVTLSLSATDKARPVQLVDASGRVLRQVQLPAGAGTIALPVSGLPAGVYLVRCGELARRLVVP
ncbi:T9SS type A sorting domain-containing protein [Hymenobacter properus]|uniref:T9SS type A sorting domain-containing protein n=1 Tax=Hymenobacter properus TaxID=2791026 RepID=A0A931BK27_9BACT|nr:T9SS type A sorting domain-containing protein [Hymenobacter properus]MBF9141708.1 T9SS type A sorting domain-containing protein [Hymenobacter properus]MBR7720517.1 T9SS type A sorting domain-containing protein [Microvirga sp. SRT04]